ncbi:MAG: hypothetical protein AB1757_28100 [Acidobacteriota bacterium]
MKAKHHFWTSLLTGSGLYLLSGSWTSIAGALVGGFLIDADHIVDQLWSIKRHSPHMKKIPEMSPKQFSLKTLYIKFLRRRKLLRLPLIFHGYEFLLLFTVLLFSIKSPFFIGFFVGYGLHLGLDLYRHAHELKSLWFYSLAYRAYHGFKREQLVKENYL